MLVMCAIAVLSVSCALTACGGRGIADNTEHFDDITKSLKLTKSFEGKNLVSSDGIGVAQLIGDTTDGDTTTFTLVESGSTITVRYQGVDTPESTSGVEKWGKAASKFTNERLHAATQIVLESASGGVPDKDSVGQRSLCYVWYKTEKDDFKCLNLELVENGYSKNKESSEKAYYTYFQKAEKFARGIELRVFSKLDDPLYDTKIEDISLKDLQENPTNYKDSMRVRVIAYVSDRTTSSSGSVTLTIAQYDAGAVYTLKLFAGYSDDSASNMRVGDLYHIVGFLQERDSAWQISGVTLESGIGAKKTEDRTWLSQISYYSIFDAENKQFTAKQSSNCYGYVSVTSASLDGTTLTFTGTAPVIDEGEPEAEFTFKVTVPQGYNNAITQGTTLSISGCYKFTASDTVLTIANYNNINIK